MNDKVEKYLKRLETICKHIESDLECIQMDIEEVMEISDLFTIEAAITRIASAAEDMKYIVRSAGDEFDE